MLARSVATVDDALHGNRIPFCDLGLNPKLCDVLRTKLGLEVSTNIQAKAIPSILHEDRKTVIMGAETGSGKTLAYLLPLIERAVREKGDVVSMCCIGWTITPILKLCSYGPNRVREGGDYYWKYKSNFITRTPRES